MRTYVEYLVRKAPTDVKRPSRHRWRKRGAKGLIAYALTLRSASILLTALARSARPDDQDINYSNALRVEEEEKNAIMSSFWLAPHSSNLGRGHEMWNESFAMCLDSKTSISCIHDFCLRTD